ncbi:hypothetical protein [Falsiroseomonas sp.]|uniref:hypothetical protein n=1 Tax=Falsiroseomonas sp. TaxID=2870721 RepID=UPI003566D26E
MPFTFARCLDPEIAQPGLQTKIVGALLTLGLVTPERDASRGDLRRAMEDLAWLTWNGEDEDPLFIRRARLWPGQEGFAPRLWIGVELEGASYRIACARTEEADRLAVAGELARLGLAGSPWCDAGTAGFHALAVRSSRWAAAPVGGRGGCYAGRIMSRALPAEPGRRVVVAPGAATGWMALTA